MTMLTNRPRASFTNSFFDDCWLMFTQPYARSEPAGAPQVTEMDDSYKITLTAPGLDLTDFDVSLEGHKLTVKYDASSKQERFTQQLRYSKSYTLPSNSNLENISASYTSGILHVTVPKTEASKSRSIEVK